MLAGTAIPLRASIDLAGLSAKDVRVEALVGRIGPDGELEETEVLTLSPIPETAGGLQEQNSHVMFGRDYAPLVTGRLGYSVRVSPNHYEDPLNRPCSAPIKWIG